MEYKEQKSLEKFFNYFEKRLKDNNLFLKNIFFHDYHFVGKVYINSQYLTDIKVYYKPTIKTFRLIISKKTEFENKLVEIFNSITFPFENGAIEIYDKSKENKNDNKKENKNENNINIENYSLKRKNSDEEDNDTIQIYIDGSFNSKTNRTGWAFCIVKGFELIYKENGEYNISGNSTRQIIDEIYSLYKAIEYMKKNKIKKANIYFDYIGIEAWINNKWKIKNTEIFELINKIKKIIEEAKINIKFFKVKAHFGNYFNEIVDRLAKEATK